MKRILISNDDGVQSRGLAALIDAVTPLGDVWVVAPELEQSAASHALSLHRPLRVKKLREKVFAVDGTPADCVYLAMNHLMKDAPPHLVLSGINHGPNLADDVIYSGTVAAAMEASLLGVPGVAFSLATMRDFDFTWAAKFATQLTKVMLEKTLPKRTLVNVNIPAGEPNGYEITRLGRHSYGNDVVEKTDPRGRRYYWVGGTGYDFVREEGTDCTAVHQHGRVAITPVNLDLTDHTALEGFRGWALEGFSAHK
ncbi:MAG: 5'/3'-nucleotidase SurE [Myxococcaceae bacterium]